MSKDATSFPLLSTRQGHYWLTRSSCNLFWLCVYTHVSLLPLSVPFIIKRNKTVHAMFVDVALRLKSRLNSLFFIGLCRKVRGTTKGLYLLMTKAGLEAGQESYTVTHQLPWVLQLLDCSSIQKTLVAISFARGWKHNADVRWGMGSSDGKSER